VFNATKAFRGPPASSEPHSHLSTMNVERVKGEDSIFFNTSDIKMQPPITLHCIAGLQVSGVGGGAGRTTRNINLMSLEFQAIKIFISFSNRFMAWPDSHRD
jgi:hypothetical protein